MNDTFNIGEAAKNQGLPGAENFVAGAEGAGFGTFLSGLLGSILLIAALLVLLYLIWGAIEWITSAGDKSKTEKARDRMTQSVIGLIVLAATLAIYMLVQSFLGVSFFNFSGGGNTGPGGPGIGDKTAGNCTVNGQIVSDGGAGGYCTNGGAARVKCFGPGQGPSGYSYNHYEPCSCISGEKRSGITLAGC